MIEKVVGRIVYKTLSFLKRIFPVKLSHDEDFSSTAIKRILIIRIGAIGDVILTTPVAHAVRERYPDAYIVYLAGFKSKNAIIGNPDIDEVTTYDQKKESSILYNLKLVYRLRRKQFHLSLNLTIYPKFDLITFLSGITNRIGFDNEESGFLLTKVLKPLDIKNKHRVEFFLDLVRAIGIKPKNKDLVLPLSKKDKEYAKEVLSSHNVSENDLLIGVHPGSSQINVAKRRWAKEGFASVADEVIRKYGAKVIILGGFDEERLAKDIIRLMQSEPINITGKTTLKQLAAIIERCDLFIHNDSAPLHIASAMKTPVVAILGYDNPKVWRPWGGKYIIVRKDLPCSPCLPETKCEKNYECIKSITPEDVLQAVENIIKMKT